MGGRYGGSDDGSDEYQSRQPTDDDLDDEQQTVAEAVQSVADRHHSDSAGNSKDGSQSVHDDDESNGDETREGSSDNTGQHPLTAFGGRNSVSSGLDTLADIDEGIADQVAKQLTERVREAVEETNSNESE